MDLWDLRNCWFFEIFKRFDWIKLHMNSFQLYQTYKIMKHTTNKPSTTHSIRLLLAFLVITSVSATTTTAEIDPSKLSTNISDTDPVDYQKKKNYNSSFLRFGGERGSTTPSSTSIANEPSARNITMLLYCDSAIMLPNPLGMPKQTKKFTDRNDLSIIPAVSSLPMKRDSTMCSMIAESKITDNISMRTIAVPHHHGYVNGNCLGNYSIVQMTHGRRSDSDEIGDEEEEVSYNF